MDESMGAVAPDDESQHDDDDEEEHRHHQTPSRTRSGMSEDEQRSRRESIKGIMADHSLSAVEKRRSIQSLMDGRRRSSTTGCSVSSVGSAAAAAAAATAAVAGDDYVSSMAAAAAAAAEYYDSSDDDMLMSDADEDDYDYDDNDDSDIHHHHQQQHNKNPCDTVFVGQRRASATASTSGDSSVSQISLGYGAPNRRGSATSSSGHNSSQNTLPPQNNDDSSTVRLIQGLGGEEDDDVKKRFRRYGRARSLQDFGDGAFAAAAAAAASFVKNDPRATNKRMEKSRPKCEHYDRNCTVVSPCCGLAFGCRICHDECPVLPPPLSASRKSVTTQQQQQLYDTEEDVSESQHADCEENGACAAAAVAAFRVDNNKKTKADRRRSMPIDLEEEETHHEIDRFAIREVICRKCFTRQSSKTNHCVNCNIQFGEYHCDICNLWMSGKESPYHCHDCGFCRVGGRENFRHCDDCGMCIDALLFDDHNCKVGKYMSNCPVCQEDLFSSRYASHEMPCGHAIHWHCFKELTSYDTRCPVCKKTAETADQMAATWSAMAMGIALQPVPADLARVVTILCYDCEQHDDNRRWHFLGVRCMNCLSFNTTVERTTMMGRDAAAFLDELDAQQGTTSSSNNNNNNANEISQAAAAGDAAAAMLQQQREVEMQLQGMNVMDQDDGDADDGGGGNSNSEDGDVFMHE